MGNKSGTKRNIDAGKLTQQHPNQAYEKLADEAPLKRRRSRRLKATSETRKRSFDAQADHSLNPPDYDPRKYAIDVWKPDQVNSGDPQQCVDYVTDIYQRLFKAEEGYPITEDKRAVIVNWLVQIHQRYALDTAASLHLAVNIFDRYVAAASDVTDDDAQVVGAACMLIASKFEDIHPPTSKELVRNARKKFTRDDLLDMECEVLSALMFKIVAPTGLPFLKRFLFLTNATSMMEQAAEYYLERLLLEHSSLQEPPSLLAAACVCLAINHPQIRIVEETQSDPPGIPSLLCEYTGYPSVTIRRVAAYVAETVATKRRVHNVHRSTPQELSAIRRKHTITRLLDGPDAKDIA